MSQSSSILLLGGAKPEASRLRRALSRHFLLVESARNIDEARELARRCRFHALVLIDPEVAWNVMREQLDGCDELACEILVITERSRAEFAIDALRDGVADVLLRPVPNDLLIAALTRAIDQTPEVQDLRSLVEGLTVAPERETATAGYSLDWTLERVKRHHMSRVLEASGGNKTIAARRLGISRRTLERKLGTRNRD